MSDKIKRPSVKKRIRTANCYACGYSGNKGRVIGYGRIGEPDGKPIIEIVTVRKNFKWSTPKSMSHIVKFVMITCPKCGSDDFR